MGVVVQRFDVFLVQLNPTIGREIQKVRPCVVISPDEMNKSVGTVIAGISPIALTPQTSQPRSSKQTPVPLDLFSPIS